MRSELCAIGKLFLRGTRIVLLKELRSPVLELANEGHPGLLAMKQRLRSGGRELIRTQGEYVRLVMAVS